MSRLEVASSSSNTNGKFNLLSNTANFQQIQLDAPSSSYNLDNNNNASKNASNSTVNSRDFNSKNNLNSNNNNNNTAKNNPTDRSSNDNCFVTKDFINNLSFLNNEQISCV